LALEDQDGQGLTYGEFFSQKPAVVAFFYTRCDNPNKCSLTITKLARLQRAIADAGFWGQLRTAAITYDPGYDLPPRLKTYGENRGVVFDQDNRMLRTTGSVERIQDYFQLGVNFGPALVNRHRIELFVLDERGAIAATFARLQWEVGAVLQQARELLNHGVTAGPCQPDPARLALDRAGPVGV
jgi:protein SCO1/2